MFVMIEDGIFEGDLCLIRRERKGSERLYIIYL